LSPTVNNSPEPVAAKATSPINFLVIIEPPVDIVINITEYYHDMKWKSIVFGKKLNVFHKKEKQNFLKITKKAELANKHE
jgi:hypothetical protein